MLARRIPDAVPSDPAENERIAWERYGIEPKPAPTFWRACRKAGRSALTPAPVARSGWAVAPTNARLPTLAAV